jgi:hypothetical protein
MSRYQGHHYTQMVDIKFYHFCSSVIVDISGHFGQEETGVTLIDSRPFAGLATNATIAHGVMVRALSGSGSFFVSCRSKDCR